jgi:hypothetical protein
MSAFATSRPARAPVAWVLNLDAEHELEVGRAYAPSRHLGAIVARERTRLLGNLVGPQDVVVTEEELSRDPELARARDLPGLAWSPTPRARALLAAAGALVPEAPGLEVLRRVNARPFAVGVRAPHAAGSFAKDVATTMEDALALLARPAPDGWLARRTFGAAGRGRRRIGAGSPSDAERAWLAASLRRGPLVVEPWVRVTREYTRSGWVRPDGTLELAGPCVQQTDAAGAWIRTDSAARGEVAREDDARLEAMLAATGAALADAGYRGPFGIDAFRHLVPGRTREVLNPMSEINARFTMDWATGMPARPERA